MPEYGKNPTGINTSSIIFLSKKVPSGKLKVAVDILVLGIFIFSLC
jgi:hypothetical protein